MTWGAGTDPSLEPGKSKARRWAATAGEGLCALGLRGLGGREGTREPGSLGCVLEVRGAVPPPRDRE